MVRTLNLGKYVENLDSADIVGGKVWPLSRNALYKII
jgi:hypothetical protein